MIAGFAHPWVLWALLVLPLLWVLLRAVPPAPRRLRFPAARLLLGLPDRSAVQERTPWWLLLIRCAGLAAVILGLAGPGAQAPNSVDEGDGPVVILIDNHWAAAPLWSVRQQLAEQLIAQMPGRPIAVTTSASSQPTQFTDQAGARDAVAALVPVPWGMQGEVAAKDSLALPDGFFDTLWISDGVAHQLRAQWLAALAPRGAVRVIEPPQALAVLQAPQVDPDGLDLTVELIGLDEVQLRAIGPDPAGRSRVLAEGMSDQQALRLALQHELRNRLRRVEVAGQPHAGAVRLFGDTLRRPKVALVAGGASGEAQLLLDPLHYLRQALAPKADVSEQPLLAAIQADPDALILADVTGFATLEVEALSAWIDAGGVLIRFAGPGLAQTPDDPFVPTPLRAGGRSIGGAMSWGSPKGLAPFAADSPFAGLPTPDEVQVRTQVLASPSADLPDRVIAQLSDGTPLVTRAARGQGAIVLVHTSANAAWSNLALSGVFPQMLARLVQVSDQADLPRDGIWRLVQALGADGSLRAVNAGIAVPGPALQGLAGPDLPPGLYAQDGRLWPVNALPDDVTLRTAQWPASVPVDQGVASAPRAWAGWLIALGIGLMICDGVASLWMMGRLVALCLVLFVYSDPAQAQERDFIAAGDVPMAYVQTGNAAADALAQAGMRGLAAILRQRSSITPTAPLAVDIERDELAFYPVLYWIITPDQPLPSAQAVARLRAYLAEGGMIVFDTRDQGLAAAGSSAENARLRALAAPLGLPALRVMDETHVLGRSFYLLESLPGRYAGPSWVAVQGAAEADGVSSVIVTGNDWIGAWALDAQNNRLLPVGTGRAGERQREMAYRTGVNLMMYALTGNYKADQLHIGAILERMEAE